MTSIERTSDQPIRISPALAWAQLSLSVICITLSVILGLLGHLPLALAIAGIGAAIVGGIQVTVHIRK
ncbi:hypothetical protein [Streptomyces cinereoruber]|uniref:hypothetical protein n=1 Tax=Streptomyces cinereoruber TaxID=67260 RepID=UPI00362CFA72